VIPLLPHPQDPAPKTDASLQLDDDESDEPKGGRPKGGRHKGMPDGRKEKEKARKQVDATSLRDKIDDMM
jgi:hypothetical protein